MGSDEQTLKQARKLIGQRDFDGAIDLLSPIDDPSADEVFAVAESCFLKATSTEDGRKSRAAYREAIQLYPKCYGDCSYRKRACREWACSARVLMDEDELKRAKEAGLASTSATCRDTPSGKSQILSGQLSTARSGITGQPSTREELES